MNTTKIRTTVAVLAAALSVAMTMGSVATAEAAVKSNPTGNSELDGICTKIAGLINHAYSQGDLALVNGREDEADAWYELARDMIRRGTAAGCRFSARVVTGTGGMGPDGLQVSPESATTGGSPSTGVSPPVSVRNLRATRLAASKLVRAARARARLRHSLTR